MNPLIRKLESTDDLESCVEIQSLVWGLKEVETVSAKTLATCLKHNALILGSFHHDLMTGFCFSLPSRWRGTPAHHSHMLAVLPEFRDQGTGFALKKAQFESLKGRAAWITWTFDPLESRNAALNLKLGVSISTYLRELYGDGANCTLHKGLGTDRFVAEWPTGLLRQQINQKSAPPENPEISILATEWEDTGFYRPAAIDLSLHDPVLLLEIPENIQKIKESSPGIARDWRMLTREGLEHYFATGYAILNFRTFIDNLTHTRRSFYVLSR